MSGSAKRASALRFFVGVCLIDHPQPCTECHHNLLDDSGGGVCYNCHKTEPELALEMEVMFHDFCRGCHLEKRTPGEDSGPLRQCSLCHH